MEKGKEPISFEEEKEKRKSKVKPRYSTENGLDEEEKIAEGKTPSTKFIEDNLKRMENPQYAFIGGMDKNKQSYFMKLRFPPWLVSLGSMVVESKMSPYKQFSELARDAVYRRIYEWAKILKEKETDVQDKRRAGTIMSHLQKRYVSEWLSSMEENEQDFVDSVQRFHKMVNKAVVKENMEGLNNIIRQMVSTIKGIDDEEYHRKYVKAVKEILTEIGVNPSKHGL